MVEIKKKRYHYDHHSSRFDQTNKRFDFTSKKVHNTFYSFQILNIFPTFLICNSSNFIQVNHTFLSNIKQQITGLFSQLNFPEVFFLNHRKPTKIKPQTLFPTVQITKPIIQHIYLHYTYPNIQITPHNTPRT